MDTEALKSHQLDFLKRELKSLRMKLERERYLAWQDRSAMYAAIIVAVLAGTAYLFERTPAGLSDNSPYLEKAAVFVVTALVVVIPVGIAIWAVEHVVSFVRKLKGGKPEKPPGVT